MVRSVHNNINNNNISTATAIDIVLTVVIPYVKQLNWSKVQHCEQYRPIIAVAHYQSLSRNAALVGTHL